MEEKKFSYVGYQEMIADITGALNRTGEVLEQLELTEQAQQVLSESSHLKSHVFRVGIMGEFKRGKSTLINALLGQRIAPAKAKPATAAINRVVYGLTPKATVVYKDGRQEEVPVGQIADYVTKITADSAATAKLVEEAVVEYPSEFCKNNVEIIDTPGLNDEDDMEAISESIIGTLDAVILVLSDTNPFSKSEQDFVAHKLMKSDVSRLIVLVNEFKGSEDYDEPGEREEFLEDLRERVIEKLFHRKEDGSDGQEKAAREKLADFKLYPISAKNALNGRLNNIPELVKESGILAFEERLRKLLTEERGLLEISRISNIIAKSIQGANTALTLRRSTLDMDAAEFLKKQEEVKEELIKVRSRKQEEEENVRRLGKEIRREIPRKLDLYYQDLNRRLDGFVEEYPVSPKELKKEEDQKVFLEAFRKALKPEMEGALCDYAEEINVYLREKLGENSVQVQNYIADTVERLQAINGKFAKDGNGTALVVGVDAISNLVAATCTGILTGGGIGLMGIGGLVEGYRDAGVKGAAVGLAGGATTSIVTSVALIAAMGTVPFLPFALITGAVGTLGGKYLVKAVFHKDQEDRAVEEIRASLRETVHGMTAQLKNDRTLENWAEEQVSREVEAYVNSIEQESEALIEGTEKTIRAISEDIVRYTQNKEQMLRECELLEKKLEDVNDTILPILEKVSRLVNV